MTHKPQVKNIHTPDGKDFVSRAFELFDAIATASAPRLSRALAFYFQKFRDKSFRERLGDGVAAEVNRILKTVFPIERSGDCRLLRLIEDLSALYAQTYLCVDGERPSYSREWFLSRQVDAERLGQIKQRGDFMEVLPLIHGGAETIVDHPAFDDAMRMELLALTAEVLPRARYRPDLWLSQMTPLEGLSPADLMHLGLGQFYGRSKEELGMVYGAIGGDVEATLLHWTAEAADRPREAYYLHAFVAWEWLNPADYCGLSARVARRLRDKRDELHELWIGEDTQNRVPERLVRRKIDGSNGSEEEAGQQFPRALAPSEQYTHEGPQVLLAGPSEVGKTSLIQAFFELLRGKHGKLNEQTDVHLGDMHRLSESFLKPWQKGVHVPTERDETREVRVCRAGLNFNPSMRLRIPDIRGEETCLRRYVEERGFPADFDKLLEESHALTFMIDDRHFESREELSRQAHWDEVVLARFFDLRGAAARHAPIALVINKADKLFGLRAFGQMKSLSLIPDGTRPELIRFGEDGMGDPVELVQRLQHCLRYNSEINRDVETQTRLREMFVEFEPFFRRVLQSTYRFQIFLTSSVPRADGPDGATPRGALELFRWMTHSLHRTHDQQSADLLRQDESDLQLLLSQVQEHVKRVRDARADWTRLNDERHRLAARAGGSGIGLLNRLLRRRIESLTEAVGVAEQRIEQGFVEIFSLARVDPPEIAQSGVAGWDTQMQVALQIETSLSELRQSLKSWHEALIGRRQAA